MSHNKRISEGFKDMNKAYEKIKELEDYYREMKKKHPKLDMWDEILDSLDKKKSEALNKTSHKKTKKRKSFIEFIRWYLSNH